MKETYKFSLSRMGRILGRAHLPSTSQYTDMLGTLPKQSY